MHNSFSSFLTLPPSSKKEGSNDVISDIILSSRIRLARNLKEHPFPGWSEALQREVILGEVSSSIEKIPSLNSGFFTTMEELSAGEKQVLVERRLISRELAARNQGCAVAISEDMSISLMINEEDHLRLQVISPALCLSEAWEKALSVEKNLGETLEFAYSEQIGFLTSCLSNEGTGMRASIMMHLPALVFTGNMPTINNALQALGLSLRGLFGEGSSSDGNIFQISNQKTLGKSEKDIISLLEETTLYIVKQEISARETIHQTQPLWLSLEDKITRAFGLLSHARCMDTNEALNLISLITLGSKYKLLSIPENISFEALLLMIQSGYVRQHYPEDQANEPWKREILRAHLLRNFMKDCYL